jgi:hypothetical protein
VSVLFLAGGRTAGRVGIVTDGWHFLFAIRYAFYVNACYSLRFDLQACNSRSKHGSDFVSTLRHLTSLIRFEEITRVQDDYWKCDQKMHTTQ